MPSFFPSRPTTKPASQPAGSAFTLIELLIVVAIISILAAIAVPNFLEAQTRAKAAAAKANMRNFTVAIEAYRVDNQNYPTRRNTKATDVPINHPPQPEYDKREEQMSKLTTPIAYATNFPVDVFEKNIPQPHNIIDYYDPDQASWLLNFFRYTLHAQLISSGQAGWMLVSVGPDGYLGASNFADGWPNTIEMQYGNTVVYDPTNGSVSPGNIYSGQNGGTEQFSSFFASHIKP